MTKVAICYWGMTRSTKLIYNTHYNKLFNILKTNNIEYNIFLHTWQTEINMIWENKIDSPIDYEEYKLLNPHYYKIDNQNNFLNSIDFTQYFNKELYDKYGGDTPNEWRPQLILNHLCALESQKRCFEMVIDTHIDYDFVIFIRPDIELYTNFDINWLIQPSDIMIPNYDFNEGYSDRFAVVPFKTAHYYAKRIDEIIDFRKNNGRIVSEKYVKFIVNKYYKNVNFINFYMKIKRPNGSYA